MRIHHGRQRHVIRRGAHGHQGQPAVLVERNFHSHGLRDLLQQREGIIGPRDNGGQSQPFVVKHLRCRRQRWNIKVGIRQAQSAARVGEQVIKNHGRIGLVGDARLEGISQPGRRRRAAQYHLDVLDVGLVQAEKELLKHGVTDAVHRWVVGSRRLNIPVCRLGLRAPI